MKKQVTALSQGGGTTKVWWSSMRSRCCRPENTFFGLVTGGILKRILNFGALQTEGLKHTAFQ